MKLYKMLFTLMLCIICWGTVHAQLVRKSEQKSLVGVEVHFRLDKYEFDESYMGNDASLKRFAHKIDSIGLERIDSVVIVSQSSPEGVYEHNMWLSKNRAKTMRRHIEATHPELKSKLYVHPDGESWQQLRQYVVKDTKLKDATKAKILSIIDADINVGTKKWRMQQLPIYRYLLMTYYPRIRNSMFCILYYNNIPVPVEPEPEPEPVYPTAPKIPVPSVTRQTYPIALKSNLLYDLATALNFEIEIPIGDKWSIMVEDVFPWWHGGNKWAFQMWEMGIEGRYWFHRTPARKVLSGHFGAVYAMSAKYDFQWKRDINYQGEYWSAGITYGYAMPISKLFNLEFSASFGYLSTAYRHYLPSADNSVLVKDPFEHGRMNYIGPTKLKVSLVMPVEIPIKKIEEVRYE